MAKKSTNRNKKVASSVAARSDELPRQSERIALRKNRNDKSNNESLTPNTKTRETGRLQDDASAAASKLVDGSSEAAQSDELPRQSKRIALRKNRNDKSNNESLTPNTKTRETGRLQDDVSAAASKLVDGASEALSEPRGTAQNVHDKKKNGEQKEHSLEKATGTRRKIRSSESKEPNRLPPRSSSALERRPMTRLSARRQNVLVGSEENGASSLRTEEINLVHGDSNDSDDNSNVIEARKPVSFEAKSRGNKRVTKDSSDSSSSSLDNGIIQAKKPVSFKVKSRGNKRVTEDSSDSSSSSSDSDASPKKPAPSERSELFSKLKTHGMEAFDSDSSGEGGGGIATQKAMKPTSHGAAKPPLQSSQATVNTTTTFDMTFQEKELGISFDSHCCVSTLRDPRLKAGQPLNVGDELVALDGCYIGKNVPVEQVVKMIQGMSRPITLSFSRNIEGNVVANKENIVLKQARGTSSRDDSETEHALTTRKTLLSTPSDRHQGICPHGTPEISSPSLDAEHDSNKKCNETGQTLPLKRLAASATPFRPSSQGGPSPLTNDGDKEQAPLFNNQEPSTHGHSGSLSGSFAASLPAFASGHRGGSSPDSASTKSSGCSLPLLDHEQAETGHTESDPEVLDLISRFASFGVSVDIEDQAGDAHADVIDLTTEDRAMVLVECPRGTLGISIAYADQTWVKICHVNSSSVLCRRCMEGDLIDWIGNWRARGKTAEEIVRELRRTAHTSRIMRLLRTVPVDDDNANESHDDTPGEARRGGTGETRNESGVSQMQNEETAEDGGLPTRYTERGTAAINKRAQEEAAKKENTEYKQQKVGTYATKLSYLHGKGSRKQLLLTYKRLFTHAKMTTPVAKLEGIKTASWPKIMPCHVLIDPFDPSNCNGGPRGKKMNELLRKKKLVVFTCQEESHLDTFKSVMAELVESNWSSERYEVKTAFEVDSAMVASGGDRTRTPPTPSVPLREVRAVNTPDVRELRRQRLRSQRRTPTGPSVHLPSNEPTSLPSVDPSGNPTSAPSSLLEVSTVNTPDVRQCRRQRLRSQRRTPPSQGVPLRDVSAVDTPNVRQRHHRYPQRGNAAVDEAAES